MLQEKPLLMILQCAHFLA